MRITEEDIRNDENASKFIDLSHYEVVLPRIDDMSEYEKTSEFLKNLSPKELEQVIKFIEWMKNGKRE